MDIAVNGLDELSNAAKALLNFVEEEKIIVFEGDMGAGKTTFIKVLCETLGVNDRVTSPTFAIVNEYEATDEPIYHFDFYRIKDLQEVYDIGYEDYFFSGHLCLIEWPQKVQELLPSPYIKVEISTLSPDARSFSFKRM